MDFEQEKTTALYPPVGADGGQPLSKEPSQSIAEDTAEYKTQADDLEEIMQQIRRASDPAYLPTVSMNDLYEQVFPGRPPVIDGLLYAGTYLFVGAPKVGKSFLMAQLAYHVSMGIPLWGYAVNRGTVLYLALEDDHRRLQDRLYRMFGENSTENLYFAVYAKQLTKVWKRSSRALFVNTRTHGLSLSIRCKKFGRTAAKNAAMPAIMK